MKLRFTEKKKVQPKAKPSEILGYVNGILLFKIKRLLAQMIVLLND